MNPRMPILPPYSLGQALAPLANLKEEQFEALRTVVQGPNSFAPKKAELDSLKKKVSSSDADLPFLFGALAFIFSRVSDLEAEGNHFDDAIDSLVDQLQQEEPNGIVADGVDRLRSRLKVLLAISDEHKKFVKLRRLVAGFHPVAISFSSFVDLRPDFSDTTDDLSVQSFVPVIQFRVRTDSSTPGLKNFVFQVDRDSLSELKKAVTRAESKLDAVVRGDFSKVKVQEL